LEEQVKVFDRGAPPGCFEELGSVFPQRHFETLYKDGFPFYRTTFWHSLDDKPGNVFESTIAELCSLAKPSARVRGVEWWFSVLLTNKSPQWILPCHFDRADLSEKNVDRIKFPEKGSVLFFNEVPYGELVVTDQVWTRKGIEPRQPKQMLFIQPRENRYAVFSGHLYHGVIGRMWRPPERTVLRITMAVNWWHERPTAAYLRDSRDCLTAFRLPAG